MEKEVKSILMTADLSGLRIPKESKVEETHSAPKKFKGGRWVAIVLAVTVVGGFWWWRRDRPIEIEAATVSLQREASSMPILSASGYIIAHQQVLVAAKTPGRVTQVSVEEGDRVLEGALLAALEASELQANVSRSQAEYDEAERQWKRYENLWKDRIVARAEVDRIETQYKVARAALEMMRAQLENMMIRAPFSGTILKKHLEVGQMLAAGASQDGGIAAFTLADLDHLDVDVDVSEGNIQKITQDHPVEVVAEAIPEKTYRGRVMRIAPSANRQKAIVQVKVRILNPDVKLKPEMSVKVTFVEREAPRGQRLAKPRVLVPKQAVGGEGAAQFVWVLEPQGKRVMIRRQPVVCGKEWTQYQEVSKGLVGGEQVVIGGAEGLTDGQSVSIKKSEK